MTSKASIAQALAEKDKGNKLFKAGNLPGAVQHYQKAEKLDPQSPVYPSNLSAALYEIGAYLQCVQAILRSSAHILLTASEGHPDASLLGRLSTRIAKALSNGVQAGNIPCSYVEENAAAIEELEDTKLDTTNVDNSQAWGVWRRVFGTVGDHARLARMARVRMSHLPIYKGTTETSMTYFVQGMDDIISICDDWGPDHADSLRLHAMTSERLSQLAFLIAGVGDGRHAFGTIIGLGRSYNKLPVAKRIGMKAHLAVLDIHPAIIARNLVLFMMIDKLLPDDVDSVLRLEYRMTLFYTYVGWVMPAYCSEILINTITDLIDRLRESPPRLPRWINIDRSSVSPVIRVLRFWLVDNANCSPTAMFAHLRYHNPVAPQNMATMYGASMRFEGQRNPMEEKRASLAAYIDSIPDAQLKKNAPNLGVPVGSVAQMKAYIRDNKDKIIARVIGMEHDSNPQLGTENEAAWYSIARVYVPPAGVWSRHPGVDSFPSFTDGEVDVPLVKKVATDIEKTWKPNVTIHDGMEKNKRYTHFGYDVFAIVKNTAAFNKKHGVSVDAKTKRQSPSFAYLSAFFDAVVDSVKSLETHLQTEFICGEINNELSKVALGTDTREPEFPKKFTRIWLSNIPDYTHGTLNTAIYVMPALQSSPDAAVSSNCLWNSPVWSTDDEFSYNYLLLLPKDIKRYLNIRTIRGEAVMTLLTLGTSSLPVPLAQLATGDELRGWLTRLLLVLLWPGKTTPRPHLVNLPNTLVPLFKLLGELHAIGYPAHWLGEFVQSLLFNNITTDRLVYTGKVPRPVTDLHTTGALHRIRLDPWEAEFEAITALALDGLPFAISIPPHLASSSSDIGLYKARVTECMIFKLSPFPPDPVIVLLFFKRQQDLQAKTIETFLQTLPGIIDGTSTKPAPGLFQIVTSPEGVDFTNKQEVQWRMSKTRIARMKAERWQMVTWRTDIFAATTEPCSADKWLGV